jgi:enoyl-CoA hydratase
VITVSRDAGVAIIRIARQDRRNALDESHCRDLSEAVSATGEGDRCILLTGEGSAFCSGADLGQVHDASFRRALYVMLSAVTGAAVPVLAFINGPAIGAGTQLAIACDLRVAAPTAVFAIPTARNGLAVDPWTVRRLALLGGTGSAMAMLAGGEKVDAHLAVQRGLADRFGSESEAISWAREIASFAPLPLAYAKRALQDLMEPPADERLLLAAFEACWDSDDVAEAQAARREGRKPEFRGR